MGRKEIMMKFTLAKTCEACPEQYDVYDETGKQVAYFRLRHGMFSVDCPDCGGETVYYTGTNSDGMFFSESERQYHFTKAFKKIRKFYRERRE